MSLIGTPYKYGGLSPAEGLDCSSLVRLLLRGQGIDYGTAYTAQTLYEFFARNEHHVSTDAQLGALVFYGKSISDIDHVAMCLNRYLHVEAAGGNSTTTTLAAAIEAHAFVKLTPIRMSRRVAILMPEYPWKDAP